MTSRYPAAVDVVVVGSGPSGAAWARVLHERAPHLRTLVLEVGPVVTDPPGDHVKNIADPGQRARAQRASEGPTRVAPGDGRRVRDGTFLLPDGWAAGGSGMPSAAMSSCVGGMAAHWTGACPRPGGSERISFLPDLDELLDEADRLLGVSAAALAGAPLAAEVRSLLSDALDGDRPADRRVQPMPLAVRRGADGQLHWSGSAVVFGDVLDTGVDLQPESLVERVLLDGDGDGDGGRGVRGVRVRDLRTGERTEVAARVVVVAADALRTPQLLHASGVRPRALGRYLNDQPQVLMAVRLHEELLDAVPAPAVGTDAGGSTAVTQGSGVSWVPFDDERHPFHGQVMQMDASPVPRPDLPADRPGAYVGLGWFCAKDVREADRVAFDDEAVDGYGLPALRIHYELTEVDAERLAAAEASVVRAGRALGTLLDDTPIRLPSGSSLHYQGTTRMGQDDDGRSVCDPHGAVWGVDGLYVAGNGVIPTETACNPTLTSVALAVRGARRVAAELTASTEIDATSDLTPSTEGALA